MRPTVSVIAINNTNKKDDFGLKTGAGFYSYQIININIENDSTSSQRNIVQSLNEALARVEGEWIGFIEPNIKWSAEKIDKQLALARETKLKVITCEGLVNKGEETKLYKTPSFDGDIYRRLLLKPGPMLSSLLVNKECIEKIGLFDETIRFLYTWDYCIRLSKFYKFAHLEEPLFLSTLYQGTILLNMRQTLIGREALLNKYYYEIVKVLGEYSLTKHYSDILSLANIVKDTDIVVKYTTRLKKAMTELKMNENNRYRSYYQVLNQWLLKAHHNKTITAFFELRNIKKIAIYGSGEIGMRIYEELVNSQIRIECFIDSFNANKKSIDEIPVLNIEEAVKKPIHYEIVVVSSFYDFEEIRLNLLCNNYSGKVISIEEIIAII